MNEIVRQYSNEHPEYPGVDMRDVDSVRGYLQYGSVRSFLRAEPYIGLSQSDVHRRVRKWDVVKNVGRRPVGLSMKIAFFREFVDQGQPLDTYLRSRTSVFRKKRSSLHRTLRAVKDKRIRNRAISLVVTPEDDLKKVLFVDDKVKSPNSIDLGVGLVMSSIPSGWAEDTEDEATSAKRVLQQEIYSKSILKGTFPDHLLAQINKPFMRLILLDTAVDIYHVRLPSDSSVYEFSSFKVNNHRFEDMTDVLRGEVENLRPGGLEVAVGYQKMLSGGLKENYVRPSYINQMLLSKNI